ncbi:unnamed protein product [Prorocentrum cordatum]|uniref:Right handed beta helix domain-containing protein n=1 Tax=Prorocentrum cordatum TaxID=2364126 RepID=A0ABN9XUX1_9DINO|nr:unnamed protein product [Polarella glacialis]
MSCGPPRMRGLAAPAAHEEGPAAAPAELPAAVPAAPVEGPLLWPGSGGSGSFLEACGAALLQRRELQLAPGSCVRLRETVRLQRNKDALRITGLGDCVIESSAYSAFHLVGRHARLELRNLSVRHVAPTLVGDGSDVGAAISLMARSVAELADVSVVSVSGLGIWLVQSAHLSMRASRVADCGRSGVAMFGHSSALVEGCAVSSCAIHGLCARGNTSLAVRDCEVVDCGRRGVYVYQSGELDMRACHLARTRDPSRAAVEAAGSRPGDAVRARVVACRVLQNAGAGVRLRGAVAHELAGNECRGNGAADLVVMRGEVNGDYPVALAEPTGVYPVVQAEAVAEQAQATAERGR